MNIEIIQDLKTYKLEDIDALVKYYKINPDRPVLQVLTDLASAIHKKGNLPPKIFTLIKDGKIEKVKEIINTAGFNINKKLGTFGSTVLMKAVINNNFEITKLLIDAKADLNVKDDKNGSTALLKAVIGNDFKITKLLVEAHADLNVKNNNDDTALIRAVSKNKFRIAKLLVDAGADLNVKNKKGETALIVAATNEYNEITKLLIKKGADLTIQTRHGATALSIMDAQHNIDLLLWLVENNIQIPLEIKEKMPTYIKLKISELKQEIKLLKKLMGDKEKELLEQNKNCGGISDVNTTRNDKEMLVLEKELEKCLKTGEDIIKYAPGRKKMTKLETKYKEHPYFRKGTQ